MQKMDFKLLKILDPFSKLPFLNFKLPNWVNYPRLRTTALGGLSQHIRMVHEGEKNFKCKICDKSFFTNQLLRRHINCVHKKMKNFHCEICNRSFSQRSNLKLHTRTIHEGIKDFKCKFCSKEYSRNDKLNEHIQLVHEKVS